MLNYEYDADAERRVIRQESFEEGFEKGFQEGFEESFEEGFQEGFQEVIELIEKIRHESHREVIELIEKLLKDGLSPDEAIASAKKNTKEIKPA